jgi:hypothetical protein
MRPAPTVEECVSDWLQEFSRLKNEREADGPIYDACHDYPEIAWAAILELLQRDLTDEQFGMLAAGPMEDLLSYHGAEVIDRVEQRAATYLRFKELIDGIWQLMTPDDIWERVERVRGEVW